MQLRSTLRRRRGSGFTLVEMVISTAFIVSLLFTVGSVTRGAVSMFRQRHAQEDLAIRAERALQSIAAEFVGARRDNLAPDPVPPLGSSQVEFETCQGYAAGNQIWSARLRLAFEYEPGEVDDDLDNNGNGIADEGTVVWTENPGQPDEKRVVKCHHVREYLLGELPNGADDDGNGVLDDRGLSLWIQGDFLSIALTLEALGPNGTVITCSTRTSVALRN